MAKVTFVTSGGDARVVDTTTGVSVMQVATSNAIPGIDAECGGVLSCATCHVYVDDDWLGRTGVPGSAERDMLEFAERPQANSRLSCQITFTDALDGLIVYIPEQQ
jgi:2Fe-2S ferredoxin